MSRFEETNDVINAISKQLNENGPDKRKADACMSYSLAYTYLINTEIAKSLAQLADDIHFLRETMAKELEGEKSKSSGPTCLDCKYSDTTRYVDKDGIVNRDVEWCERKHQKINFDDKPVCDYFKPVEAEG